MLSTPLTSCSRRQAIGIPRRTAGVAAESRGRLHRDSLGGENDDNGSCRSHRRERRTDDSSIQGQRRCSSLSLHRPAARRTRMHDDEYDARAALPDCDGVRNVRPGASEQRVSPHDRYEPVGLAPGAGDERRGPTRNHRLSPITIAATADAIPTADGLLNSLASSCEPNENTNGTLREPPSD